MKNIKLILTASFLLFLFSAKGQSDSITLDSCYLLAKQNYPLVKQYELIAKTREYTLENISKGFLPQININGQTTYQSDVTQLPKSIPGVPVLTRDQYKIYAEINQPIYDGGVIKAQKEIQEANTIADQQKLEIELYQLKDRVNQLYFGVLMIDAQLKQNDLMKKDIQSGLEKINALVANGVALKSNADILKAELLKAGQQTVELSSSRKAMTDMLGLFIDRHLNENTVFKKPADIILSNGIKRPELLMFDYQNKIFDAQNNLLSGRNRPKISFFVQGGFGKPAFNILSNDFDPFYIGGLRLNFPVSGFYSLKNGRKLLDINKRNVEVQRQTFVFNTQIAVKQQNAEILKFRQFLKTDDEIISLRESVKKVSLAQLQNGVINSNDYIRDVNAEDLAQQNKILHKIHMLMAEYKQQNIMGE